MTFNIIEQVTSRRRSSSSGSLPPSLQARVDKAEEEQDIYEDSWTRRDRLGSSTLDVQQKKTVEAAVTHPKTETVHKVQEVQTSEQKK